MCCSCQFVAISTEYYFTSESDTARQFKWLQSDLQNANQNRHKTPWIVVYGHRPPYCSNFSQDDCAREDSIIRLGILQADHTRKYGLEKFLHDTKVDLAVFGHEHSYERFHPHYAGDSNLPDSKGVYHDPSSPVVVITGAAGGKEEHDAIGNGIENSAFRSAEYGFGILRVEGDTHLYFEQRGAESNRAVDSFTIKKKSVASPAHSL